MGRPSLVVVTGPPGTGKSTLAEAVSARAGGAAVLAFDWAMAGMRGCPPVRDALEALDRRDHAGVGWGILGNLAEAQLRAGRSVVLDGVARQHHVDALRTMTHRVGARLTVIVLCCSDPGVHRSRIEGRRRDIPGWYELTWSNVELSVASFEPPADADLVVDTAGDPDPHAIAARLLD
jgi:predicted kinase